jgi:phosphatidylglycerol---prolipoprotein diacylglyceryl transferase
VNYIIWNVDPEIVRLGPLGLRWYGLLFATGLLLGYLVLVKIYRNEARSEYNLSTMFLYILLGILIGARLGHVLFYQPDHYLPRPWEIPMIWEGGLASHGAFIGVLIAIFLYLRKYREMGFLELSDRLAIPGWLAASFVRLGNFFNSEIFGIPSTLPWAIIFLRVDSIPRHPAMLYEWLAYVLIFALVYVTYWKNEIIRTPGRMLGLALSVGFTARFFIEFVKAEQAPFEQALPVSMGQLLSLPFIFAGLILFFRPKWIAAHRPEMTTKARRRKSE